MELNATKRTEFGKKNKKVRLEGKLPAVVFAKGMESLPLTVSYSEVEKVFREAGETTLVDLKVSGGESMKILISELEIHPVTGKYTHANFHKVNLKEKIAAMVPVELIGEAPAVKSGVGLLLKLIDEINVEALPADLPHKINVDISKLEEVEQGITVKELDIDLSKVKILDQDPDELVVKVDYAEMKEEEAPAEAVSEAELVSKVQATEQLTEEEKAKKESEKKAEKEKASKE